MLFQSTTLSSAAEDAHSEEAKDAEVPHKPLRKQLSQNVTKSTTLYSQLPASETLKILTSYLNTAGFDYECKPKTPWKLTYKASSQI